MSLRAENTHYIPLSANESWQLINQLTQKGLGADEAIEQIALVNYIAKREHLAARQIVDVVLDARQGLKTPL